MTHEISLKHTDKIAFDAQIGDHSIHLDTSAENGGENKGPSPKRLMLVSLAGCTAVDVVMILNKKRVKYSDLGVDVQASLTEENPKIYDKVTVSYSIKVDYADQEKVFQAVELSSQKYCGVMAMFRSFAEVKTEVVFL